MTRLNYDYDDTCDYNKSGDNVAICCEIARSYYQTMAFRMKMNRDFARIDRKYSNLNFVMTGKV